MNPLRSPMEQINWIGKLADLKNSHADVLLVLHALIELLIEKRLITREELTLAISSLDTLPITDLIDHPKA